MVEAPRCSHQQRERFQRVLTRSRDTSCVAPRPADAELCLPQPEKSPRGPGAAGQGQGMRETGVCSGVIAMTASPEKGVFTDVWGKACP